MTYCKNPGARLKIDVEKVAAWLKRKKPIKAICKHFRIGLTTAYEIARIKGLPLRLKRLTDAEYDGIVAALKAGKLYREIAAEFGVSRGCVWRVAEKNGIVRNPHRGLPIYAIERAFEMGKNCQQIADEIGRNNDTVRKALIRRGHDTSGWGKKATMAMLRECVRAKMNGLQAAKKFGASPCGPWYKRWNRAKQQVREGKV